VAGEKCAHVITSRTTFYAEKRKTYMRARAQRTVWIGVTQIMLMGQGKAAVNTTVNNYTFT